MHKEGDEVHIDDIEASGGSKEGVVRWVLMVGTVLAIAILSVVWIAGASDHQDADDKASSFDQFGAANQTDRQ